MQAGERCGDFLFRHGIELHGQYFLHLDRQLGDGRRLEDVQEL
jgi:hypothetical protein